MSTYRPEKGGVSVTTNETFLVFVLAIALVAILLRSWLRSRGRKQGIDFVREAYPIWAVQGPFESGEQSAAGCDESRLLRSEDQQQDKTT
jgi:hypothetical protein